MSSAVSGDWRSTARSSAALAAGCAVITLLAFWLLARVIDWNEFLAALGSIPLGILALVVLIYLVSMVVRALAWQFLLQRKVTCRSGGIDAQRRLFL